MGLLGRRKPLNRWSPAEVFGDVEAAFFSDPDERYVRAAVVFRYVPERLPKDAEKEWRAQAEEDHPGRDAPAYAVYMFGFDEGLEVFVEEAWLLPDAVDLARGWAQPKPSECDLFNLPGIYVAALCETVTGTQRLWNEFQFSWFLPGDAPLVPHRVYPPRLGHEVEFALMPVEVGQLLFRRFLESRTLDSRF